MKMMNCFYLDLKNLYSQKLNFFIVTKVYI
jgi:hypothetical protein